MDNKKPNKVLKLKRGGKRQHCNEKTYFRRLARNQRIQLIFENCQTLRRKAKK